ncbi:MAG: hypothetical protein ACOC9J_04040, partial [Persicimonas sp.]
MSEHPHNSTPPSTPSPTHAPASPGGESPSSEQVSNGDDEPVGPDQVRDLFVVVGFLSLVLAAMLAVTQWLSPWMPFAIASGVGLLIAAAIAFGFCNREHQRAFAVGAAIVALAAAPTLLWMVAPVRAMVQKHLGANLTTDAHRAALDDPVEKVQEYACLNAAQGHSDRLKDELVERFSSDTKLARACLGTLQRDEELNQSFTNRYYKDWREALDSEESGQVCRVAKRLFDVAAGQINPARELTHCAVGSENEDQARCCADQLTDQLDGPEAYLEELGSPSDVAAERRAALFRRMVPHVFEGVDAARTDLGRLERQLLRHEPVERWVLALGCYITDQPGSVAQTLDGLEAIGESRGCNMYDSEQRKRKDWRNICTSLGEAEDPTGAICRSVRQGAVASTSRTARSEVHKAIDALQSSRMAADISSTDNRLAARNRGTASQMNALMDAIGANSDTGRDASTQSRRQMRALQGGRGQMGKMFEELYGADIDELRDDEMAQELQ